MKHKLVTCAAYAGVLAAVILGISWFNSFRFAGHAYWAADGTQYEFDSFNGRLVFCRHADWPWRDPFTSYVEPAEQAPEPPFVLDDWPGWNPKVDRQWAGFQYASGTFLTAFRFTSNPRSTSRAYTRFHVVIVPYWFAVLLPLVAAAPMAIREWRTWRTTRQDNRPPGKHSET